MFTIDWSKYFRARAFFEEEEEGPMRTYYVYRYQLGRGSWQPLTIVKAGDEDAALEIARSRFPLGDEDVYAAWDEELHRGEFEKAGLKEGGRRDG